MKWLLDTNVVSETIRPRPHSAVLAWLATQPPEHAAISIVTLAELQAGIQSAADPRRRTQLLEWADRTVPDWFQDRILPLTVALLTDWLQIGRALARGGSTRDPADLLIAATARAYDLVIVSRNVRDFAGTGTIVYDPWNDKTHRMEKR